MLIDVHTHRKKEWFSIVSTHARDFLAGNIPENYYTAGLHPWYADKILVDRFYGQLMDSLPENMIAIGECGLDRVKGPKLSVQQKVFERQLDLARELQIPVIIHQVKTLSDIFPLIKHHNDVSFVLHGFQGNLQQLNQLLKYNVYFSFGETTLNAPAKLLKVIGEVPLDRIFFETDDSDCQIQAIYNNFAATRKIGSDELEVKIERNFTKLFKISIK